MAETARNEPSRQQPICLAFVGARMTVPVREVLISLIRHHFPCTFRPSHMRRRAYRLSPSAVVPRRAFAMA